MKRFSDKARRALAVSSMAGLLAAGCAANRTETGSADAGPGEDDRRAADTSSYPGAEGTGGEEGGTMGGAGETAPPDPTATDTGGVYGDPNAWPTGPMPGDTGVGGAGDPAPDTVWMDTAAPPDTFGIPEEGPGGMPGGGTGPDVW